LKSPEKLKRWLRWLPGLAVSLAAVYFLARFISPEDLLKALRSLTCVDIFVIFLIMVLSLVSRAMGWKKLLNGVNFRQAFLVVNQGYLFNNLIPRSGEIIRTLLISGSSKISAFQVASSILVERALDMIIAASMFLLTLPFALDFAWIKPIATILFAICVSMFLVLAILARKSDEVKKWIAGLNIKSAFLREKIIPRIGSVLDGLDVLNRPIQFALSVFWILTSWLCWTTVLYFGMSRLMSGIPFWWAIFAQSVLALGIALPSAPAGLGVYEGTMVAALAVFGFDQSGALSIALVLHFVQILITSIFGIYGLAAEDQTIGMLLEKMRLGKNSTVERPSGE